VVVACFSVTLSKHCIKVYCNVFIYASSGTRKLAQYFHIHVTAHRDIFPYNKPTRYTNFSNLFWNETLHVSDSSSVHHQELFTVHLTMVYVIQVCRLCSILIMLLESCVCDIYVALLSVQWITRDGQRNCRKHVEFHFQNKFEKLVYLVGFIIRKFVTMHGHMNVKKPHFSRIKYIFRHY
jgi:hypothetical protein